jgi:hypothetical protein
LHVRRPEGYFTDKYPLLVIPGYIYSVRGKPLTFSSSISTMYFRHWKPPGVPERMWSVNLDASISGEYQTVGEHSYRPSE